MYVHLIMDKKLGHIGDTQTLVSGGEIQCMTHSTTPTASCSLYNCTRGRSITTGVTSASNLEVYDHWPSSCMSITVERVKVWCIVGHTWHTFLKPDNSPTNINQKCAGVFTRTFISYVYRGTLEVFPDVQHVITRIWMKETIFLQWLWKYLRK